MITADEGADRNFIHVQGASSRNLKDFSFSIPLGQVTVLTGPSGSGKSACAFDVLAREAAFRARLVEHGVEDQIRRPVARHISGLPPTLAFSQHTPSRQRLTLLEYFSTLPEITTALNRSGALNCPHCHTGLRHESAAEATQRFSSALEGCTVALTTVCQFPKEESERGKLIDAFLSQGFNRGLMGIEGEEFSLGVDRLTESASGMEVLIDRLTIGDASRELLTSALQTAAALSSAHLVRLRNWPPVHGRSVLLDQWSPHQLCPECGYTTTGITRALLLELLRTPGPVHPPSSGSGLPASADFLYLPLSSPGFQGQGILDQLPVLRSVIEHSEDLGVSCFSLASRFCDLSATAQMEAALVRAVLSKESNGLFVFDEPTLGRGVRQQHQFMKLSRLLLSRGNSVVILDSRGSLSSCADTVLELKGQPVQKHPQQRTEQLRATGSISKTLAILRFSRESQLEPDSFPLSSGSITTLACEQLELLADRVLAPLLSAEPTPYALCSIDATVQRCGHLFRPSTESTQTVGEYIDLWQKIAEVLTQTPLARARGYTARLFSPPGAPASGSCVRCEGTGLEPGASLLHATPVDACSRCRGERFEEEYLEVRFKGFSACELLYSSVGEIQSTIDFIPRAKRLLFLLHLFELDHLPLGRPLSALSLGEYNRLRLVPLFERAREDTLYILELPNAGLSIDQGERLMGALQSLLQGNALVLADMHPAAHAASDRILSLPGM